MSLSRTSSKSGAGGSGRSGDATPYLQQLRRQLSNLGSTQKPRRGSTQPPGPAAEKSAAICSAVQLALQGPLAAVQLDVSDVSCARLQYRLLGTKRYWYRSVKQEKQGKVRWEVKIFQTCCRKSTVDALIKCTWDTMPRLASEDVTIKSVGFFDTEKAAMAALEAAIKSRDATNPFTGLNTRKIELPLELIKYFQVVVVSDMFQRKSQNERLDMIFELLLSAAPNAANTQEDAGTKLAYQQPPTLSPAIVSNLRGFSTVSDNVIAMSIWRSLTCHFIVCAKTPAQWKAGRSKHEIDRLLTERFGLSHLANNRAFNVNQGVLPISRGLAELVSQNQEELLSKHKTESVPHFYHGLPDEVKRMIAEEQTKMNQGRAESVVFQKLAKNTEGAFVKKYLKRRRESSCEGSWAAVELIVFSLQNTSNRSSFLPVCSFNAFGVAIGNGCMLKSSALLESECAFKRFRAAIAAAKIIQKFWRSHRYYQKWMELMEVRRRDRKASHIGSLARGILARKYVQREKRKRYHRRVLEPSAAKIQRVFRGYIVRKRLEDTRDQIEAAITLQQMWRSRSTVKTIKERLRGFRLMLRESAAGKIQRCYLWYKARQELNFRRHTHQACFGKAALAVQAAWRSYCTRKQLKEFRLCSLIERKACSLTRAKEDREMIEFDIFDARADLKRVIKYKAKTLRWIKEMKEMRIEWERRQPVVEKELSQLTEEDIDRGWGEAFETEKHILRFSLELSVEDILSKKQQAREYEAEIEELRIELEDLERDMEECILSETMELEAYRDMELQRAGALFAEEKTRRVRLQRIRWGTRNVRKRIILRERQDLQEFAKEAHAKRQVEELGVLAFEKKQFVKRKLEQAIEDAARSRAKDNEVMMEMKRNSAVLHGFDEAVQRMQAITQEYSFHYRLPKSDLREDPSSAMCSDCGRITCDCHLQNESGDENETSDKLGTNNTMNNARNRNRLARRWRYQD
ncbi:unnamed protein product [Phytophthora fragariaefolia]|uniref:Unnamed protein product n=1 Tax=Phytophthora fragariaefolia TaxID=1490495 RepID=A0A9W6UAV3_9STRA|nr:unnamed protein product [Phytophthora fragariaefolia]